MYSSLRSRRTLDADLVDTSPILRRVHSRFRPLRPCSMSPSHLRSLRPRQLHVVRLMDPRSCPNPVRGSPGNRSFQIDPSIELSYAATPQWGCEGRHLRCRADHHRMPTAAIADRPNIPLLLPTVPSTIPGLGYPKRNSVDLRTGAGAHSPVLCFPKVLPTRPGEAHSATDV